MDWQRKDIIKIVTRKKPNERGIKLNLLRFRAKPSVETAQWTTIKLTRRIVVGVGTRYWRVRCQEKKEIKLQNLMLRIPGQVSREALTFLADKATKFNVADPGQVSREALTF